MHPVLSSFHFNEHRWQKLILEEITAAVHCTGNCTVLNYCCTVKLTVQAIELYCTVYCTVKLTVQAIELYCTVYCTVKLIVQSIVVYCTVDWTAKLSMHRVEGIKMRALQNKNVAKGTTQYTVSLLYQQKLFMLRL